MPPSKPPFASLWASLIRWGLACHARPRRPFTWPLLLGIAMALLAGALPVYAGRHLSVTPVVLSLVVFATFWRGAWAGLLAASACLLARAGFDLGDADCSLMPELWNMAIDMAFSIFAIGALGALAEQATAAVATAERDARSRNDVLLARVIDHVPLWVCAIDRQHRFTVANKAYADWIGAAGPGAVIGRAMSDFYPDDEAAAFVALNEAVMRGREVVRTDKLVRGRLIMTVKSPLLDASGTVNGACVVGTDVTGLRQTEATLLESERNLQEAQAIAGIGSFVLTPLLGAGRCSAELLRILGVDEHYPLTLRGWLALIHPDWRGFVMRAFRRLRQVRTEEFNCEYRIIRASDRAERWIHNRAVVVYDASGAILTAQGTIQDITVRHETGEALRLAHLIADEAERATAQAVRDERARVGRELHDGLAQQLAAMAMTAGTLARGMEADGCDYREGTDRLSVQLRESAVQSRRIARGLLSEIVPGDALLARLSDLATETGRDLGRSCSFASGGPSPLLSEEQATHLFLIAREAMRNALAHAGPKASVTIRLQTEDRCLSLSIADDGVGPPAGPVRAEAMGRQIMAHRARLIGASYFFGANPEGRGTAVSCLLSLAAPPLTP